MKRIQLLDTSIGTSNMGDFIIMECVREELNSLLKNNFVYNMPTHLPAFSSFAVWRNSSVVKEYTSCDYKFVGGSNILVKNLRTHYPQWNINPFNSKPLNGAILVGVGAGTGELTNKYTTNLYKRILSNDYYHSVRDERSKKYVEDMGLKAINTGCVTMWLLKPEFCKQIPISKSSRVVFTLTSKGHAPIIDDGDQFIIDVLKRNYKEVYFWVQSDTDLNYFNQLNNTDGIQLIPPSIEAYKKLLQEDDLDYVGTRLHGGVYAMRHKKRALIIAIDERAREINKSNNINCIDKNDIYSKLEHIINSNFSTDIKMPFDMITKWIDQF